MKKILIAVLLCIPFIIIATINLSEAFIVSANPSIVIENIDIFDMEGNDMDKKVISIDVSDYIDSGYVITAVIYPSIAKNNEVRWTSSDTKIATVDSKGLVSFTATGYGEVTITCASRQNKTINASMSILVTGRDIFSIDITPYDGELTNGAYAMQVGERQLMVKDIIPATAISDKIIVWSSSNSSVVDIDANGVVTAKSVGTATINASVSAEVNNGKSVTGSLTVTVGASTALLTKNEVYIAANTLRLSDYTNATTYSVSEGNATIADGVLTYGGTTAGDVVVNVVSGTQSENFTVHFTSGEYLLGFANLDVLQQTVWNRGNFLNLKVLDYALVPIVLNDDYTGSTPSINLVSSNTSAIDIRNGKLYGLDIEATSTITATATGFVTASIVLETKNPVQNVYLELDEADDERGIEGTRVFGNKFYDPSDLLLKNSEVHTYWADWYNGGDYYDESKYVTYFNYTYSYQMKIKNVFTLEDDDTTAQEYLAHVSDYFTFKSSNEEYATVDNSGLITFTEAAANNTVTISVQPVFSYGGAYDSYTFKVIDAMNLGLDCENTAANPDFTLYYVMRAALQDCNNTANELFYTEEALAEEGLTTPPYCQEQQNIVLHTDIYFPAYNDGQLAGEGGNSIDVWMDIYGNGYTLDGRYYVWKYDAMMLQYIAWSTDDEQLIQNLTINPSAPFESDDSEEMWNQLRNYGGFAVRIDRLGDWEQFNRKVTLRYVTIQNTFNSVVCYNGDITLDGCLFVNTVSSAVMISPCRPSHDDRKPQVTLKNCIISNTLAPAIFIYPAIALGEDNNTYSGTRLIFKGNNYIYNWKRIEEIQLDMIPSNVDLGGILSPEGVNAMINSTFKKMLEYPQYDPLKVRDTSVGEIRSKDHINLGVFALGVWYDTDQMEFNITDDWEILDCSMDGTFFATLGHYPVVLISPKQVSEGVFPTMPNEDYSFASDENGDPIWRLRLLGQA